MTRPAKKLTTSEAGPQPTFPNNPTWEQKCRKAWDEVQRLEAERLANAKQIHDLNRRLGIGDTSASRIRDLEYRLTRKAEALRTAEASWMVERKSLLANIAAAEAHLNEANERIDELESASVPATVDSDGIEEALTEAVRAVKAVRRGWRE